MEMNMEIIVPAAGLSTRFPHMKPKYLLFDYKHQMMLCNAVSRYKELGHNINIGILKEHNERYHAKDFIQHELGEDVNIIILDQPTRGPAETVYEIIKRAGLTTEEILVKDCDSFFDHDIDTGNYVCVSDITKHEVLKKLASKSFVIANEQSIITNIIEKQVVSNTFCVGGYKFESAKAYTESYEEICQHTGEIFVSDVIGRMIDKNYVFSTKEVTNYFDVGTAQDWFEYNDKPVIFCDIDGTLILSQSRVGTNTYYDPPVVLENNVATILEYQNKGSQIIFTTSRPKSVEHITREMLEKLGFKNVQLICGLLNSRRILVNDFNEANPYPRAEAVNIFRNDDTLKNFL